MADYNERVAERIVNARERKGMSAETLALRAGVSIKQMGRIESGKSIPRLSTIRKIADALDLTVVDIRPDLDVEERELRAQLDRIEANQRLLLLYFGIEPDEEGEPATRFADAFSGRRVSPARPSRTAAAKTT
jgi:transcriptional regulator with XRE-family HTH domain